MTPTARMLDDLIVANHEVAAEVGRRYLEGTLSWEEARYRWRALDARRAAYWRQRRTLQ